ncbi:hypothetical protein LTR56_023140 [Elasticomyces elasticus]|nr:hypothetical protein LTR56_023140 [Elasticomyces elasticus]KAK3626654.1 hypothetical protein LTR22_023081 [Elasticomyces elasticus]KAK4917278.1 hypothetical protein LTR49_014762 [Elasticomyces elasticus]KAK5764905.1 hypothetical protein LTS12_004932 [Elasticomyces elasticus]
MSTTMALPTTGGTMDSPDDNGLVDVALSQYSIARDKSALDHHHTDISSQAQQLVQSQKSELSIAVIQHQISLKPHQPTMSVDLGIDTLVPGEPGTKTVERKYIQNWSRNGKKGTFITKFLVSHPADNISLRGISIKYYIHIDGEERRSYVGELIGNIVDRHILDTTGTEVAWLREVLRELTSDLQITFDDIYTREGKTRDKFKDRDNELQVQHVAHVAEFQVEPRLQGFGKLALIAFHHGMQDLIGFEGTIILCPRSLESTAALDQPEYEYEMGLVEFYEKCNYRVIYTEENVAGATVMGVMLIK